jgi:hypothetical protein
MKSNEARIKRERLERKIINVIFTILSIIGGIQHLYFTTESYLDNDVLTEVRFEQKHEIYIPSFTLAFNIMEFIDYEKIKAGASEPCKAARYSGSSEG